MPYTPNLLISIAVVLTLLGILWLPSLLSPAYRHVIGSTHPEESWLVRLVFNLLGYSTIIFPGYLIFRYVKTASYLDNAVPGPMFSAVQMCFFARETEMLKTTDGGLGRSVERTAKTEAMVMLLCFFGLQGSYLTWGVLQEKIMTRDYVTETGSTGRFSDSQFLVFVNRILAFLLSGAYILSTRQPRHTAPVYKYSYCSFSNIMSSWCQYEALKFVSFPTQVLAKASKIIPVMLMGKIVSRKSYEYYEYLTAGIISVGMTMFLMGSTEELKKNTVTTFSGVVILIGYMAFDSFTSNWQSELFSRHRMSSVQMMCGVNVFSCLLTAVSLIQQGGFAASFSFMMTYPKFVFDILLLSLCSALGQLFIFFTIAQFGAVVFVIIMTVRQGLAILLSCFIYNHAISSIGIVGSALVFAAIFLRIYCNQRLKYLRRQRATTVDVSKV